jgi:hypothetical protein
MSAHPRLADDAVMLGSRSSSRGLAVGALGSGGAGGRRITMLTTWLSAAFGARQNRVIEGRLGSVERPAPAALEPKATETVDGRRA